MDIEVLQNPPEANAQLSAHSLSTINWNRIPQLLIDFRDEQNWYQSKHEAFRGDSLSIGEMVKLHRCTRLIAAQHLDPDDPPNCLPVHQELSTLLDRTITEAVHLDKRLLRGAYRELADQELSFSSFAQFIEPIVNFAFDMNFKLRGPEGLIHNLISTESHRSIGSRANLCAIVLQRVLDRQQQQSS